MQKIFGKSAPKKFNAVRNQFCGVDNIPYAAIRTPAVRVPVYGRSVVYSDIQEKDCGSKSKLNSWPYRVVAFLNEVIDIFVLAITEDFL